MCALAPPFEHERTAEQGDNVDESGFPSRSQMFRTSDSAKVLRQAAKVLSHAAQIGPRGNDLMRLAKSFVPTLLVLLSCCPFAHAERRIALVVGNSGYQHIARLANPSNDAQLMADTLKRLGFTLVGDGAQIDLDKGKLDVAVQSFGKLIQSADVALFYFAGHGVQVLGSNYLVPVNANVSREADVGFQMLDINLVLQQMHGSGTRLNVIILDACRNNPFGGRGLRAAEGGLAQMRAPEGTLISYATQPGSVAQDGDNGNSPYTRALAETLKRPGLGLFDVFNEVGLTVQRTTGGAQQPWVSASPIAGSFYFASPSISPSTGPSPPPQLAVAAPTAPVSATGAARFDGSWLTTLSCPAAAGALGFSNQFIGRVQEGIYHGAYGTPGQPGSLMLDGEIHPDGKVEMYATGVVGASAYAAGNVAKGTKYGYHVAGRFEDLKGTGSRIEGRPCNFVFTKQ